MSNTITESPVLQLENITADMLPELHGWREKQQQIVAENPFVVIDDNKSWEAAKKARTNLVTARTTIEKQEKLIASKLKDFRNKVAESSKELIGITLPYEEAQQEEVKRYEAIKEEERKEKERQEAQRKQAIKDKIELLYNTWKTEIANLQYSELETFNMNAVLDEVDTDAFEEFEMDFEEKRNMLNNHLAERKQKLEEEEQARLEREKLAAEKQKLEAERAELERKMAEEKAKAEKAAKAEAQKQAKIKAQQEAEAQKLKQEREALEAEKQRLADIEAQKQAEIEANKKAEVEAKAKQEADKRAEALRPDIEKLQDAINSITFTDQGNKALKDEKAQAYLVLIRLKIEDLKTDLLSGLNTAIQ